MRKIIIAGGSGFIGQYFQKYFSAKGFDVVVLSRHPLPGSKTVKQLVWNGRNVGEWQKELEGAFAVINLAGKNVNCRYNERNKKEILDSRVNATYVLGKAINQCKEPPLLWINAASATIYRHAEDRPMDEITGELGEGFSVNVCKEWEKAFFDSKTPGTRKVCLRIAITVGKKGGVMGPLVNLVKFGLGGKIGNGRQMFSWVHEEDLARVIAWTMDNYEAEGVFNVSSPNPVSNAEFMRQIRKAKGMPFGLPSPEWLLKIGAVLIGTEAELILKSRWVLPTRLQQMGFVFKYPELSAALKQVFS